MTDPFQSVLLSRQTTIRHGFFSRQGGVSQGLLASLNGRDDATETKENLEENRRRVSAWFDLSPEQLLLVRQVHGNTVLWIEKTRSFGKMPEADALVTQCPRLILCIRTADCVPILLYDPFSHMSAAVHAGWKSALRNIVHETIKVMAKHGANPQNILAAIGPCIHQKNFEIQEDVFQLFKEANLFWATFFKQGKNNERYWFDLPGLVRHQLQTAGLIEIDSLEMNTYADEDHFFSYRRAQHRQENIFGNQFSAISLISPGQD